METLLVDAILSYGGKKKKSENVSHSVISNFLKFHGILQARPRVAIPFFRASSQPRDQTRVSCIAGKFFTI